MNLGHHETYKILVLNLFSLKRKEVKKSEKIDMELKNEWR